MTRSQPYVVVPLTKGYVAIIDRADWKRVKKHKWRVHFAAGKKNKRQKRSPNPYARASIKGKDVYLHIFLMQNVLQHFKERAPETVWHVDHKNHQTLDCRGSNLEVVSDTANYQRRRYLQKKENKYETVNLHYCTTKEQAKRIAKEIFARSFRTIPSVVKAA